MLTAAQKSDFDEHGWVRVPCAIPDDRITIETEEA